VTREDIEAALPDKNWFCCAIANSDFDDTESSVVEKFIRIAIDHDILSLHALGQFGGKLHLTFDLVMVKMEVDENYSKVEVCTVNDTDISEGFWGCYGAPCLPERADFDTVKLICVSFDGHDYRDELKNLIFRFKVC